MEEFENSLLELCDLVERHCKQTNHSLLGKIGIKQHNLILMFKNRQNIIISQSNNNGWIDVNRNLPEPLDTQKQLRNQHNKHQVFYIDECGNKSVDYAWYVLADIDTQIMPVWELCSDISTIITPMYWQPISMPDVE